ncbi:hypothetical protein HZS_5599 [Henneguya salminicola]|nr:hypothetical protein HZS_5599 [Henneguya salminicola]
MIRILHSRWTPKLIIIDFEIRLIKAVKAQFSSSRVPSRFFKLRRRLGKKIKKFKISEEAISGVCKTF